MEDCDRSTGDREVASLYHRLTALAVQHGLTHHETSVLIAVAMCSVLPERPRPTQMEFAESARLSRGPANRTIGRLCELRLLGKSDKGKAVRYWLLAE